MSIRRPSIPALVTVLALVGLYAAVAFVVVQLLLFPLVGRLSPGPTVLAVVAVGLLSGYVSYRVGTGQLLARLPAAEVSRREAAELFDTLDRLTAAMDVRQPRVLVGQLGSPNALSVAGRPGALVVDARLASLLSPAEFEAVLAHELAHLEGRDALVRTLGASLVGTVRGLLVVLLLPVGLVGLAAQRLVALLAGRPRRPLAEHLLWTYVSVGLLVVAALFPFTLALRAYSRRQELAADDRAAAVTDPLALADGLARIQRAARAREGPFASLYIHGDEEGVLTRWLATHPPMDDRIRRLRERAERRARTIPVREG